MPEIQITIEHGYYAMRSPRDQKLIDLLKALIPARQRSWNPEARAWLIDPKAIDLLLRAIVRAGYEAPDVAPITISTAIVETIQKQFTVEYVGQCKEREQGVISALGSVKGFWSIEFPEEVLKAWFQRKTSSDGVQTFYQVLCIFENATDQEIKSAYRRLSRQWHPDVCQTEEDNPGETFRKLTDAYEVLREPQKRRRYDAGLFFEREAKKLPEPEMSIGYGYRKRQFESKHFRAPLRCGLITAEGSQRLNRFTVSKILAWDDITDGAGRVMTAGWNKHTESIEVKWV